MPDDRPDRPADTGPAAGSGRPREPKPGMRCTACGLVWYSDVAALVVEWSRSVCCRAPLELQAPGDGGEGAMKPPRR